MHNLRVGLASIALFSVACGGNSGGDSQSFVTTYCTEVAKCCGQAGLPSDGKTCREWTALGTAGGSYSASAGDACLAEMRAQVSAGTFCSGQSTSTPSACDSVYGTSKKGTKKPGETCEFDSDCAPSSDGAVSCEGLYTGDAWLNKCQVRMVGKAGNSPCVGTQEGDTFLGYHASDATDIVSRGYVCDTANNLTCKDGICVALTALGARCVSSSDCVRGAYCSYSADVCTTKVNVDGACTSITGSECVDSAYCDTSAKKCTTKVANGGACTSSAVCQSDYCSNNTCQGSANPAMTLLCGN